MKYHYFYDWYIDLNFKIIQIYVSFMNHNSTSWSNYTIHDDVKKSHIFNQIYVSFMNHNSTSWSNYTIPYDVKKSHIF